MKRVALGRVGALSLVGSLVVLAGLVGVARAEEGAVKNYTWDNCIVCNKKLGADGKPVGSMVVQGQELKACQDCMDELKKEPEKYLAKYKNASESKQGEWAPKKPEESK